MASPAGLLGTVEKWAYYPTAAEKVKRMAALKSVPRAFLSPSGYDERW
jgi:hypothetical protein